MNIACFLERCVWHTCYDEWLQAFKDVFGIAVTLGRAESGRAEKQCV